MDMDFNANSDEAVSHGLSRAHSEPAYFDEPSANGASVDDQFDPLGPTPATRRTDEEILDEIAEVRLFCLPPSICGSCVSVYVWVCMCACVCACVCACACVCMRVDLFKYGFPCCGCLDDWTWDLVDRHKVTREIQSLKQALRVKESRLASLEKEAGITLFAKVSSKIDGTFDAVKKSSV